LKKLKDMIIGIIALLIIVVGVGFVLYYIGQGFVAVSNWLTYLFETISMLDTVLIIALISASITIIGIIVNSIISIIIKSLEHRHRIREEIRTKMEIPYEKFVDMIYDIFKDSKKNKQLDMDIVIDKMYDFSKVVTLHGSNKVVKKWVKFRTSFEKLGPAKGMKLLEEVLYAIRSDLGIKKRSMKSGDLLSLFTNDIDEFFKKK